MAAVTVTAAGRIIATITGAVKTGGVTIDNAMSGTTGRPEKEKSGRPTETTVRQSGKDAGKMVGDVIITAAGIAVAMTGPAKRDNAKIAMAVPEVKTGKGSRIRVKAAVVRTTAAGRITATMAEVATTGGVTAAHVKIGCAKIAATVPGMKTGKVRRMREKTVVVRTIAAGRITVTITGVATTGGVVTAHAKAGRAKIVVTVPGVKTGRVRRMREKTAVVRIVDRRANEKMGRTMSEFFSGAERTAWNTFRAIVLAVGLSAVEVACTGDAYFHRVQTVPGDCWVMGQGFAFEVNVTDTVTAYDVYVDLRSSDGYPWRNIYVIGELRDSARAVIARDTLMCELSDRRGKATGKGLSNVKENAIRWKKNYRFPYRGTYGFSVTHGMRNVELPGVSNVGIRIEIAK